MLGSHCVKTWSSTQKTVALSSGEAEYLAMVKGGSIGLGIRSMLSDFNIETITKLIIKVDSTAAIGIASRRGLGKVRHIDVADLWLQDRVHRGEMVIAKVPGEARLADGLTKYLDKKKLEHHIESTQQIILKGRHHLSVTTTSDQ